MRVVAVIPARGGSRRIPKKNIKLFHSKPIIAYSIEAALESGIFDEVIVSTNSEEIASVAIRYGASVRYRSEEMSRDEVGTQEVAKCVLQEIEECKYACLIYPCSPMISVDALRGALDVLISSGNEYVVPVATWLRDPGQWYFGRSEAFINGISLIGPGTSLYNIDPKTECDINTPEDWDRAIKMYEELTK